MVQAFRDRVTVSSEGSIEIRHPDLAAGTRAEVIVLVEPPSGDTPSAEPAAEPPIWEVAAALGSSVPAEEWEKVPRDLSRNLDHYLYGAARDEE